MIYQFSNVNNPFKVAYEVWFSLPPALADGK
jgi:hypothetical protein